MFWARTLAITLLFAGSVLGQVSEPLSNLQRITGVAVDERGFPLAGVGVVAGRVEELTTRAALEEPEVTTGADGRFEIIVGNPLSPALDTGILWAAKGRRSVLFEQSNYREVRSFDVGRVCLASGAVTLIGRVVTEEGEPIADATVWAVDMLSEHRDFRHHRASLGRTDEAGLFRLTGCCASAVSLTAHADGRYSRRVAPVNTGDPLRVALRRSRVVSGRMLNPDGVAAQGAVVVRYEGITAQSHSVPVVDGAFRFTSRYPCRFGLFGYDQGGGLATVAAVLDGSEDAVEIRHSTVRGPAVVVRALDALTRDAVPSFRAYASWKRGKRLFPGWKVFGWNAPTSRDGVVRLSGPPERREPVGELRVVAPGMAPQTVGDLRWEAEGVEVTVALQTEAVVRGRVVAGGADGPALVGAGLYLYEEADAAGLDFRLVARTQSGADGTFQFGGLATQRYKLVACHPSGQTSVEHRFGFADAERGKDLTVVIASASELVGRVTGVPEGAVVRVSVTPFAGEAWSSYSASALENFGPVRCSSDIGDDGGFKIADCTPGEARVHLDYATDARGGAPLRVFVAERKLRSGATEMKIDASLFAPATLRGTIACRGVVPRLGQIAVVSYGPEGRHRRGYGGFHERCRFAIPSRKGEYRLRVVPGVPQRIGVFDLTTGVALHVEGDPIELASGEERDLDIELDLAELTIELEPMGERVVADFLEIHAAWRRTVTESETIKWAVGVTSYGAPGVRLAEGATTARALVPVGPVSLSVRAGYTEFKNDGMRVATRPLGTEFWDAESGAQTVSIEVDPPRAIAK